MLRRVGPEQNMGSCRTDVEESGETKRSKDAVVKICDAHFPKIFPWRLEYNCPVHENWNIVHTGMLVPETQQIYVCPVNCLRGVVMTAGEMDAAGRISSVMPTEREVVGGRLEEVTIKGVADVIGRLKKRPRAVELFLVCMHHLTGTDERYIYDSLQKRFPDIDFMRCWMDPIMQKISLTPEQKQRKSMMGVLAGRGDGSAGTRTGNADFSSVSILGDDLRLPETSDISRTLTACGIKVRQVQDCEDYDRYLSMGDSFLYLTRSALSVYGLEALARENGRRFVYLPPTAMDSQIDEGLRSLVAEVTEERPGSRGMRSGQPGGEKKFLLDDFLDQEKRKTREIFEKTKEMVGDTEIWLDYLAFPRPMSFARRLLCEGFRVTRICMDAASPEEEEDFLWLKEHAPDLEVQSTSHVKARQKASLGPDGQGSRGGEKRILALGPKAAFFADTPYFVNWIENDGNWGYDGLRRLASAMAAAYREPKDTRDLVQRKGLGLPSLAEKAGGPDSEEGLSCCGGTCTGGVWPGKDGWI